jgi:hypothetical protein
MQRLPAFERLARIGTIGQERPNEHVPQPVTQQVANSGTAWLAVALLVLLARAAWARIIAANLLVRRALADTRRLYELSDSVLVLLQVRSLEEVPVFI